jgi:uncharacterized protein
MPDFRIEGASVTFWLNVKPRSARERLTLGANDEFRLEIHAPATEGQANEACVQFLARALHLPQACLAILSGARARRKLLRITGHSPEETMARLKRLAAKGK